MRTLLRLFRINLFPNSSGDNYKVSDLPTNFLKKTQFVFFVLLRVLLCCTSVGLMYCSGRDSAFNGKRNTKVLLLD